MFNSKKSIIISRLLISLVLVLVGVILGWFFAKKNLKISGANPQVAAIREGEHKYINPLLECEQSEGAFVELTPFKTKISEQIAGLQKDSDISSVAVYFRDMNNGPWFGINKDTSFSPASLLKLPLAIAYYKLNENSPDVLQKQIMFNGPASDWPNITQSIPPTQPLIVGQSYSIEQLIERMLVYSDNQAYYILFSNINLNDLAKVYKDFGIDINGPGVEDDSIVTVQKYSSFFRILFNASYLNQADSEKILSFLANTEYKNGLVAGVPKSLDIAHKFGERKFSGGQTAQIHDCGIIYYPNHPYLLCVMTRGNDLDKLSGVIQQVSSSVYSQVDNQYSGNK